MNKLIRLFCEMISMLTVVLMLAGGIVSAQVNFVWDATYNGPANTFDGVTAMATDAAGNVYVAGYSDADSNWQECDYATIKYNWAGQQQWVAIYNGSGNGEDKPTGIGVDDAGNVYVTGWSEGIGTDDDFATIKYDADGVEQWVVRYNGPGNGVDLPQDLTLDHDGNIIVAGAGSSIGGGYPYWDQTTIKYNSAGVQQWVAIYAGSWGFNDVATAVAVDSVNNVVITGWSAVLGNYYDYNTVKYNPAGVQQWAATYAFHNGSYDGDNAYDVAVDAQGNVYVTGMSDGDTSAVENDDIATIKYNSAGVQQWVARYNGPGDSLDWAFAIHVDNDGNVYVPGSTSVFGGGDAVLLKYNTAGVLQWTATYNGSANTEDGFYSVALDTEGNAYVPGWSNGQGWYTGGLAILIKYNSAGVEQWLTSYSALPNGSDWFTQVALTPDGDIVVAGKTGNGSNDDFLTVKYDQPDVTLTLTPHNPPILIPPGGGNFQFDLQLQNTGANNYAVDIWTDVTLPGGYHYPIVTRSNIALNAGGNILRPNLTQFVPASALPGEYFYNAYVRDHNTWEVLASDAFSFVKLEGDALPNHDLGWALFGWDGEETPVLTLPMQFALHPARPNPFNPSTVIHYQLAADSRVKLAVFDVSGRLVTTLADGWQEAGVHKAIFDGSGLPSGIYVAQLTAGEFTQVQKLVLMK